MSSPALGPALAPGPGDDPPPVLALTGVLAADLSRARAVAEQLAEPWGGVDLWGEARPFDQTRYYEPEMGGGLSRFFCSFQQLVPAQELPRLKAAAWALERQLSRAARRTVNLDPGLLDLHKVVLASFKPGPQKLYLGCGVWADIVLYHERGAFEALRWTFPDLRGAEHRPFFAEARLRYRRALRGWRQGHGDSGKARR